MIHSTLNEPVSNSVLISRPIRAIHVRTRSSANLRGRLFTAILPNKENCPSVLAKSAKVVYIISLFVVFSGMLRVLLAEDIHQNRQGLKIIIVGLGFGLIAKIAKCIGAVLIKRNERRITRAELEEIRSES